jgi:hypothetical protein
MIKFIISRKIKDCHPPFDNRLQRQSSIYTALSRYIKSLSNQNLTNFNVSFSTLEQNFSILRTFLKPTCLTYKLKL